MTEVSQDQQVFFNENGYKQLNLFLKNNSFSKIFILVDTNTHTHCLSPFLQRLETEVTLEVIEMEAGEEHKNLETCNGIWKTLSELGGDRKSLLINLGGGVVTDLGGFVAATFKRGISFVHFPTTLLAMVDAAVGGKNGINLDGLKNQIGTIRPPEMVVADISFLTTLPSAEMRSGLAEMLKHGLIRDEAYWNSLQNLQDLNLSHLEALIRRSVEIKEEIVRQDPEEKHLRKSLNYGHTLGHAIETYFLETPEKTKLLHGEAVAAGMVLATYLSNKTESFPEAKMQEIRKAILAMYGKVDFLEEDQKKIIELLKFDKKNEGGKINFVLLRKIGEPVIDRQVSNELIYEAFRYYLEPQ
ncbi:3-dehydroquinate synthase [Salinimicrobium soli]|uniref:3-dehydroquinate synthase n=1 Tax=Salinimicrobium soli TaxID=1254399 RepID=UPI003AAD2C58